ncbi:MAG: class I SAM-dependent methyltransferase, partial [Bacteroidota bacterium]
MRADPYEDYSQQVTRQLDLHYRPFSQRDVPIAWQPINDFVRAIIYKGLPMGLWVEIGCGVGSLIGDLAAKYPKQQCYGFDYSYQMLRVAQDYWRATKPVEWLSMRGFGYCSVSARPSISNVA